MARGQESFERRHLNVEDQRGSGRYGGHVQPNEPNGRIRAGRKKLMGARSRGFLVMAGWRGIATLGGAGSVALSVAEDQRQS